MQQIMKVRKSESLAKPAAGRASQRVLDHLAELRSRLKPGETLRIPPVRQLAQELKVSKATIYHAFKQFSASGDLTTAVGRGSFLKSAGQKITVGLAWPIYASLPFTRLAAITHALLHASMSSSDLVELRPVPPAAVEAHCEHQYILDQVPYVDALIFPTSLDELAGFREKATETYEAAGKPVVLLDAPALNATRNFVAPDMFAITQQIGYALAKTGRKRIAFLMKDSVNATVTTLHALIGLKSGIAQGGNEHQQVEQIFTAKVSEQEGYNAIIKYLDTHSKAPDAIYCFGDVQAWGAMTALEEKGISVPEEVSVIGGTGFSANLPTIGKFSAGNLTRVNYSFESIARGLLEMTFARVRKKCEPLPGVFVPGTIIGGLTTRPEENALLPIRKA